MMSQMFQGNPAMERAMEMTNGKSEEEIKQIKGCKSRCIVNEKAIDEK